MYFETKAVLITNELNIRSISHKKMMKFPHVEGGEFLKPPIEQQVAIWTQLAVDSAWS